MNETRIMVEAAAAKPKYRTTAAELLKRCREFYQDTENEAEYQKWKESHKEEETA